MPFDKSLRNLAFAAVGAASLAIALWQLLSAETGVTITRMSVGATPVTVFAPASDQRAPVVVIAHGFAGSQQLMAPFALTFARNGYVAVTFDLLGHGRNPRPLTGSITEVEGATKALVDQFGRVAEFARRLPAGDGRIAVLGHSMATDIVVRYAQQDSAVTATIAVSLFSPVVTPDSPRNLLVIDGALEPSVLRDEGLRVVAMAAENWPPSPGTTYGSFADGTARRVVFSPGVEHIGVLYSRASLREALDWLNAAFGRPAASQDAFLAVRGPWIGLLIVGFTLLARPLSALLPRLADQPLGASLSWRRLLPVALAPAILTPLILWKAPTDFLPILVGDYLVVHFALYGALTAAGLFLAGHLRLPDSWPKRAVGALIASIFAVVFYTTGVFAVMMNDFVTSFVPTPGRVVLIVAMLGGTLPYFVADEWATRGAAARRGSYAFTKFCFLLSLAIAVALNLNKLFFLIIIVPIILVFFLIYGLFSGWVYERTRDPFVAATANAVALAWAIAVTFPMLGG